MSLHYTKVKSDKEKRTLVLACDDRVTYRLSLRAVSRAKARGPLMRSLWRHVLKEHPAWASLGMPALVVKPSPTSGRMYIQATF